MSLSTQITSKKDFDALIASNDLVAVQFSTSWCAQCKKIKPKFEELSAKLKQIKFASVDSEKVELTDTIVSAVPEFRFYKGGALVGQFQGADEEKLAAHLSKLLPPAKPKIIKLTEDLAFSVQPTVEELKKLKEAGFKSVINMRSEREDGFLTNERALVEEQGLQYQLVPIFDANDFTKDYADGLLKKIDGAPKPLLLHCKVGLTSAVGALLYVGKEMEVDLQQILLWGKDFGHNFAFHAQLYQFLQSYMA